MNSFASLAPSLQTWLVSTALEGAVWILVVLLLHKALGSWLSPRWRYFMWCLVALRMALPMLPTSAVGLSGMAWSQATPTPTQVQPATAKPFVDVSRAKTPGDEVAADSSEEASTSAATSGRAASDLPSMLAAETRAKPEAPAPTVPWWTMALLGLWAAGASLSLFRLLYSEQQFRRRLAQDIGALNDPKAQQLLRECLASWKLSRAPQLLECSLLTSPALCGWRKPKLLLPRERWQELSPDQLRHVLMHELAHQRHHDVLMNWVLALVRVVHWYHPLLPLACRRLRESQELWRDEQALQRSPEVAPRAYAATLLKLAIPQDRRPQPASAVGLLHPSSAIQRRIHMILQQRPPSRLTTALGVSLLLTLGAVGLTKATAQSNSQQPGEESVPILSDIPLLSDQFHLQWQKIEVVRASPEPEWFAALTMRLNKTVSMDLEDVSMVRFADLLREELGINVILGSDAMDSSYRISVLADQVSARDVLDLVCSHANNDFGYMLHRNVLVIDSIEHVQSANDMRFYDLRDLLSSGQLEEDPDYLMDQLQGHIHNLVTPRAWDQENVSMRSLNGRLVVRASNQTHRELKSFLEFLLNRGREPQYASSPAAEALALALQEPMTVQFDGQSLGEAVDMLRQATELPIYVDEEWEEDGELYLQLNQVPIIEILAWLSDYSEVPFVKEDSFLRFTHDPPLALRAYSIGDLIGRGPSADFDLDNLMDLVHETIGDRAWDVEGTWLSTWNDLLIIRQSEVTLREVENLLIAAKSLR